MVNPSYNDLVTDYGRVRETEIYKVVVNQQGFPLEIHHSRLIRMEGDRFLSSRPRRKTAGGCPLLSAF
jgi:hypothetical protein